MLRARKIKVDTKDGHGQTALHVAEGSNWGGLSEIRCLLQGGSTRNQSVVNRSIITIQLKWIENTMGKDYNEMSQRVNSAMKSTQVCEMLVFLKIYRPNQMVLTTAHISQLLKDHLHKGDRLYFEIAKIDGRLTPLKVTKALESNSSSDEVFLCTRGHYHEPEIVPPELLMMSNDEAEKVIELTDQMK